MFLRGEASEEHALREALARALIPPPFFPTIADYGVFAARSTWRPLVMPKVPEGASRPAKKKACAGPKAPKDETTKAPPAR